MNSRTRSRITKRGLAAIQVVAVVAASPPLPGKVQRWWLIDDLDRRGIRTKANGLADGRVVRYRINRQLSGWKLHWWFAPSGRTGLTRWTEANGSAVLAALERETHTIPIVFAQVDDPVAAGLVASLAQPGGNVTSIAHSIAAPMRLDCGGIGAGMWARRVFWFIRPMLRSGVCRPL